MPITGDVPRCLALALPITRDVRRSRAMSAILYLGNSGSAGFSPFGNGVLAMFITSASIV
jgi:hypothetical protein